jgi:dolichol-phosphate mannosyltransferase
VPLNILSAGAVILFGITIVLMIAQLILRIIFPDLAPRGATTTLMFILFFGSVNLMALSIIGEYLAKIFEEVKRRPHFIRRSIIREGNIRLAAFSKEGDGEY